MKDEKKGEFCAHCGGMVGADGYALDMEESEESEETPETTQMESTETMRHFADAVSKRRN